uniref:USP domain-containing protein n=1 Tax=Glossina brevipalpis TaxID=37001 RepID=A0A1A9WJT7_9MUSC
MPRNAARKLDENVKQQRLPYITRLTSSKNETVNYKKLRNRNAKNQLNTFLRNSTEVKAIRTIDKKRNESDKNRSDIQQKKTRNTEIIKNSRQHSKYSNENTYSLHTEEIPDFLGFNDSKEVVIEDKITNDLNEEILLVDVINDLKEEKHHLNLNEQQKQKQQQQQKSEEQLEYEEKPLNNGKLVKTIVSTTSTTKTNNKKLNIRKSFVPNPKEVSARLATLRNRRITVASDNNVRKEQKHQSPQIHSHEAKESINNNKNNSRVERKLKKKAVAAHVETSDLNKIESFPECGNLNKRKRRVNAVKRKRLTFQAVPLELASKLTGTTNTTSTAATSSVNAKKKARIMSLYERRYQTTDEGRGSGVSGSSYLSGSRNNPGTGTAGSVIMAEVNDSQEVASQFYLTNSGITTNASGSLVGNGSTSVINHAPSMATLCNIGNTCYLNSVVYTLRFAPQFLHNLHHLLTDLNAVQQNIARARAKSASLGRGMTAAHMENARSFSSKDLASMEQYSTAASTSTTAALSQVIQKSSHQVLAEKLHELFQSLYRNEFSDSMEPHHADTLLHAIQDVSTIFEGNQQQDAHEFLMCVLNSIRETSQTLIKAIAECPDVIMNGFITNPEEMDAMERENQSAKYNSACNSSGGSNNGSTSALSSLTSAKPSLFSRKSKRKEELKNSKSSRLQSPLKEGVVSGSLVGAGQTTFYLNSSDLNSSPTAPATAFTPTQSMSMHLGIGDETDNALPAAASLLKDKQRLLEKIRELGLDFFTEDFEGITVSTTKCLSCETITEQKETMIDIAVPVPQAGYESNEHPNRSSSFIQNSCITREYFRNENKYRCEQCTGYTEAIRSISYEVLPRLLVIQLSRFSGGMEKINSYIPTSFTLQCFCSKCCELSEGNKLHIYRLYSVITHVGATMSVGHYIAYTCSLDFANEYVNCPKDQRRRRCSQERNNMTAPAAGGLTVAAANTTNISATASITSSGTSFMKKMKFGRSKASSSGDMSKNVKHLNGLTGASKAITNGIGKLSMNAGSNHNTPMINTTCQSINCCAMRLCAQQQQQQQQQQHLQQQSNSSSFNDFSEDSSAYPNGSGYTTTTSIGYHNNHHHGHLQAISSSSTSTSGYSSTGRGSKQSSYTSFGSNVCTAEPIWYMCDDDKIKAMTQREFEDLLSPARKITITPYLLFYARFDLQPTPPKQNSSGSNSTLNNSNNIIAASTAVADNAQANSWSNESLQNTGILGNMRI